MVRAARVYLEYPQTGVYSLLHLLMEFYPSGTSLILLTELPIKFIIY